MRTVPRIGRRQTGQSLQRSVHQEHKVKCPQGTSTTFNGCSWHVLQRNSEFVWGFPRLTFAARLLCDAFCCFSAAAAASASRSESASAGSSTWESARSLCCSAERRGESEADRWSADSCDPNEAGGCVAVTPATWPAVSPSIADGPPVDVWACSRALVCVPGGGSTPALATACVDEMLGPVLLDSCWCCSLVGSEARVVELSELDHCCWKDPEARTGRWASVGPLADDGSDWIACWRSNWNCFQWRHRATYSKALVSCRASICAEYSHTNSTIVCTLTGSSPKAT